MLIRPEPSSIPETPGSYQFRDAQGRMLYVGKAKSLRARLSTYFGSPAQLPARTRQLLAAATSVEWIEVRNEVEALFLEFNLIKAHKPRFNIRLRDDKSYPYLAITTSDRWPRALVTRGAKRPGTRVFGPYAHAYAVRETLDLLLRTFPVRTCSDVKLLRHERLGRPCLFAHIEKCAAPCVEAVSEADYAGLVEELMGFLDGDTAGIVARLETAMGAAATELDFERAARLRDQLGSVRKVIERQQMVGEASDEFDAIGLAEDPLEASVQVFSVRRGRMVGRKGIVVDKVEDVETPALVARLLEQLYGDGDEVPREILVPVLPEDLELHEEFLTAVRGGRVRVRVRAPARGDRRAFMDTVTRNAEEAFVRHRLRRSSDHNARARALTALQEALELAEAPLRIECYDISNLQGTEIVGSMVVMEDGLAKRSDYRRFKVRSLAGQDDFAAMEEVLHRRFSAYLREREEGPTRGLSNSGSSNSGGSSRVRRFAYPPNLCLVDGGKGQLGVAQRVLDQLGLSDEIEVASLAKRFEEVYRPGRDEPVRIPRDSEALYLLQQVRDEAHRFAVTYHRQLRGKRMTRSILDEVPGLGPARRSRLLREFGSVRRLRAMSEEELVAVPWLPDAVARSLHEGLHGRRVVAGSRLARSSSSP